jgi:Na+-transporting methylmalonyl-CoA/oxaloacetate decarboxylase gamma subunit
MGIVGKLLITFAVIIFLSTLALVGYLIYQNIDKFIPPNNEPVEKTIEPEVSNSDPNETKEENLINLPDPFAAPDQ